MKVASVIVKLTKNHHVHKHGVTPIEALILAAEHNVNSQGDPLEVMAGTEKDVPKLGEVNWTEDAEIARLKRLYAPAKVAILKEIRTLPTSFADAIGKGKDITMPGSGFASAPNATVLSQTHLK